MTTEHTQANSGINSHNAARLKKRHSQLNVRVARLEKRLHLTSDEEMTLQTLKKEKLYAKDELQQCMAS